MQNQRIQKLALLLLLTACVSPGAASDWYCDTAPCSNNFDWQLFAPIHDVCAYPNPKANEGYFFSADRMHFWMMRPDRASIGLDTGAVAAWVPNSVTFFFADLANNVLGNGLNSSSGQGTGGAGTPQNMSFLFPVVGGGANGFQFNGIDDAYTETGEGWGNRVEFGRVHDDCGWNISILGNVEINEGHRYGFDDKRLDQLGAAQGTDGINGSLNPIADINGDGVIDVNDRTPVAAVAGQQALLAIDGLLAVSVLFNDPLGLLLGNTDVDFNQVADDLNGDGVIDANDLTRIAVVFDDLEVNNRTRLDGIEANLVRRKRRLRSGFDIEGYLGIRYLSLDDRFTVLARGGTLADSDWDNNADNRIIGPQFGFRASRQQRQWITNVSAKFLAGANFLTIRQHGTLGSHLTVGAPGVPLALGSNSFFHRAGDERFSPVGEFRAETAFQATRHITLRAGWTGLIIGDIARASNTVVYDLPTLGIRNGREEVFSHSLTFGIDVNR